MPPFLPVVLAGAALYGAYRWARAQWAAEIARAEAEKQARAAAGPRDLGSLERDPDTGVYRPKA